jgi:hypothetical protein
MTNVKNLQILIFKNIRKTFLLIYSVVIMSTLFSCDKNNETELIINKVDIEKMAQTHLQDFKLLRKRSKHIYGKEYVYSRESDSVNVSFKIGLHQSTEDAGKIADEYFNEISAVMNQGPYHDFSVGNRFWWLESSENSGNVMSIVFIRKNALFIMGCDYNYGELKTLAKKMDDDILNNAGYVDLGNTILLPVIDSITATKTVLKEGESAKITVHASDPNNEQLEYDAIGLGSYEPDPSNVFTLNATHDNVGVPFFGSHKYKFVVINESNVVSEVADFEIMISQ